MQLRPEYSVNLT